MRRSRSKSAHECIPYNNRYVQFFYPDQLRFGSTRPKNLFCSKKKKERAGISLAVNDNLWYSYSPDGATVKSSSCKLVDFADCRRLRFIEFWAFTIRADDAIRRRGYCDHFVTLCVWVCWCVCGCVCHHDKPKTPDRNDLKLGTIAVLGSLSKPIDFGFKSSIVT